MARITTSGFAIDTLKLINGGTALTDVVIKAAGVISLGGVSAVTGSVGADTITLLGTTPIPAATVDGVTATAVSTFTYDTKNATSSTPIFDILNGSSVAETINLSNTGTSGLVHLKYTSGGTTAVDTLVGTTAIDTITLNSASKIIFQSASGGTDVINGSTGSDTITLSDGVTTGTARAWSFKSGGGTDNLTGNDGIDTITLSAASTFTYNTGGGADVLIGSTGNDIIQLGTGFGATATFTYTTGGGTDTIQGTTTANDTIVFGGSSSINLKYSSGSSSGTISTDTLTLLSTKDIVTLTAASKVTINTGGGADEIYGSSSSDTISVAGAVGVTIRGYGGADSITAPTTSTSSTGISKFYYGSVSESGTLSTTRDTITNFDASGDDNDLLVFASLNHGTFDFLGASSVAFNGAGNSEARFNDTSDLLEVDTDGNGTADMSIVLTGVSLANLDETDFSWS